MSESTAITWGLPYLQNVNDEQTNVSFGLRITAVILGALAMTSALLSIYANIPGLKTVGTIASWAEFSSGALIFLVGISMRSVKKTAKITIRNDAIGKGISISESTNIQLRKALPNMTGKVSNGNGVTYYSGKAQNRIFSLDCEPTLVFKMGTGGRRDLTERYGKMIMGQQFCKGHDLNLLVIPNAILFTMKIGEEEFMLIAERKLNLNPQESAQEQLYEEVVYEELLSAFDQLCQFIVLTDFSDVKWSNIPILRDKDQNNRKIGLVDLEEFNGAQIGLFGEEGADERRGLVGCVTERLGQQVGCTLQHFYIQRSNEPFGRKCEYLRNKAEYREAVKRREKEIRENLALKQHYESQGITTSDREIYCPQIQLFDPATNLKIFKVAQVIVSVINRKIKECSPDHSIKGRRKVFIRLDEPSLEEFNKPFAEGLKETIFDVALQEILYKAFYRIIKSESSGVLIQA